MVLSGIFSLFKDLDKIPLEDISRWLKNKADKHSLQNFIANIIIYPQTVPLSKEEMEKNFALLKEAIRREPGYFYNSTNKKLIIPSELMVRFPPLISLASVFMDALNIQGVVTIYMKKDKVLSVMGSIFAPKANFKTDQVEVVFNNQKKHLKVGEITVLPIIEHHVRLKIADSEEIAVVGGEIGVIVDLR